MHTHIQPSLASQRECTRFFRDILDAVPSGWIAGGALRDFFSRTKCTSDIDVFFQSMDDLEDGMKSIEQTDATQIYDKENIVGYLFHGRHVQFVKRRFFNSLAHAISSFDFTVCSAGIDHNGLVLVHKDFFEDLAARRLVIHSMSSPIGTYARLGKYTRKGFKADNATLLQIADAMRNIPREELDELKWYSTGRPRSLRFTTEQVGEND